MNTNKGNFAPVMKPKVYFQWVKDLTYQQAWDRQTELHKALVDQKLARRNQGKSNLPFYQEHQLIFCEHNPVFTLGKSGSIDHLLLTKEELEDGSMEFFKINRGGDITYHGPGQITGYPIFDLEEFYTDVHKYVRMLEEVMILTLADYGLTGIRIADYTGVWLGPNETNNKYRKICAIGVHLSRWVSMHGFAFNVNTHLDYFNKIVPCGIQDDDKTVTSLSKELGRDIPLEEVGRQMLIHFSDLFQCEIVSHLNYK